MRSVFKTGEKERDQKFVADLAEAAKRDEAIHKRMNEENKKLCSTIWQD